jgi:dTDP-4-amino-4,6-dideoxygalactose transaminase
LAVFKSNYIAPLGPNIDAFERQFSEYTGIPHCLAVTNGTAAMHLALQGLQVLPGDIVLASTFTFIGSVAPATYCGAELRFVDCDKNTWNMDASWLARGIEDCIGESGRLPKVVVPTDLYGQCADYDAICKVCQPYDIPVVIDSAEAIGATYKGRHAGNTGHASIFSFNGNKIITTSSGGMLASHSASFIDRARKISSQAREQFPYYEHTEIGNNYRMSNVLAAIGCGQLETIDWRIKKKWAIFNTYRRLLSDIPEISFMPEAEYGQSNRWLTTIEFAEDSHCTPELLCLTLEEHNVEARPLWKPMHLQPVFRKCRVYGGNVSEQLFRRGLCLPSGLGLTDEDIERICGIIKATVRRKG